MSITDPFLLGLQAYQEIQAELRQPEETACFVSPDPLLAEAVPEGALLLGLAEDGLPLNLDLYEPGHGPLLVSGDRGCGKTGFLRSLALLSSLHQDVQFGVVTPFPEEWGDLEAAANCLGIWPAYHPAAGSFLLQMANWAENLAETRQVALVLVDNLEAMKLEPEAHKALRWLAGNGPQGQVWPVVAVNADQTRRFGTFLQNFQTRVLGYTRKMELAAVLTGDPRADLASLKPGAQFYLTWPQGCLRFWIPPSEGVSDERGNAVV